MAGSAVAKGESRLDQCSEREHRKLRYLIGSSRLDLVGVRENTGHCTEKRKQRDPGDPPARNLLESVKRGEAI
jgi:hypothetical protein